MKKLLVLIAVLLCFILVSCESSNEEITPEYNRTVSAVADVLGVELTGDAERVLLVIIDNTPDFIWWAEQNGHTPLSLFPSEDIFNFYLTWNGLPEEEKRPPVVEPDPYYWDSPPPVVYEEGYWSEWNLNYDWFIYRTNYMYVFVKPDGTSDLYSTHPNAGVWAVDGIPIPFSFTEFNAFNGEGTAWAIAYYLEHFTGENADYKLPDYSSR